MCTVTVVPTACGFRLVCNRDERASRAAGLGPRDHAAGLRRAAFPVDPQSGGTWVGVNDRGLAMAILNRNDPSRSWLPASAFARSASADRRSLGGGWLAGRSDFRPKAEATRRWSRGRIIPALLRCASLDEAVAAGAQIDPVDFEPFRLVLVAGMTSVVISSDGRTLLSSASALDHPILFMSSSLGDRYVIGPRRRLFERLVVRNRRGWIHGQEQFHRHQWRSRPDVSVMMKRTDARTVSRTRIDVACESVALYYEPIDSEQFAEAA